MVTWGGGNEPWGGWVSETRLHGNGPDAADQMSYLFTVDTQ